jgi:ubiquitin C-terminal hydrolase
MELIPYNNKLLTQPAGFVNGTGFSCYYNSLLQCLLSCTSIYKFIEKSTNTDMFAQSFKHILQNKANIYDVSNINMLKFFNMKSGQQDATELLRNMFEYFESENPDIWHLFNHRIKVNVICDCGHISSHYEENLSFDISQDLLDNDLNNILLNEKLYTDDCHKCVKCEFKGAKLQTYNLVMVPEILVVSFKKFIGFNGTNECIDRKKTTQFPNKLLFAATDGSYFQYKLVSCVYHHGGMNGGHYTADASRKDGWYHFDDMSFTKMTSMPKPTSDTYIIFYHYEKRITKI